MRGTVDDKARALVSVPVAASKEGPRQEIVAWIDTAFNSTLVVPRRVIEQMRLVQESSAEAILADGTLVEVETFACYLDWFGKNYETQVTANDGELALLGTMLLDGHRLVVDYLEKSVELT